jgi:cell division protein FtsB
VLNHPGPDRSSPEARHIRLVEDVPLPKGLPGLGSGGAQDVKPKKDKKGRNKVKATSSESGGSPKNKGHAKKVKATKRLAAELQGLGSALNQLRSRLTDLHSVQLDHAESNAALSQRVEVLDGLAAGDRERGERLARHLDQLSASVEGLGSRVAEGVVQGAALEGLAARIARAESAITLLQDQPDPSETADRVLGEVEGRLAALRVLLDAQLGRLERVEQGVEIALRPPGRSELMPWRVPLETLQRDLDGRLQRLKRGLHETQEEAQQREEALRSWTRGRLSGLVWRQTLVLGLLGLLVAALLAADWWRTDRLVAGSADRLGTLEQRLELAAVPEPSEAPLVSQEMMERLRRLESGLLTNAADLASTRQAAEASAAQLADLSQGQQSLTRRLDTLQQDLSEADKGFAELGERVSGVTSGLTSGLTSASIRPADPVSAPVRPDPSVLGEPRYGIQLVAYRSRSRIGPFVQRFGLGDRASITEVRVAGRPAYAVLLGPYDSESAAGLAIGDLPAELRTLGPWVRRLPAGTRLQPWE